MSERETIVDFTIPFYHSVGFGIIMKKPLPIPFLFTFVKVMKPEVWGCILAAFFSTSFLLFLHDRLSPYSYYNNKEKYKDDDDDENTDFSFKESFWFCLFSLTPQGGGDAPRNLSGRLVAITWWLFGFIIIASYTANLAAFLTASRLGSEIQSLDDLLKQDKIKFSTQESTLAYNYLYRMGTIENVFAIGWLNTTLDNTINNTERAKLAVWDYPMSDKYMKIYWKAVLSIAPKTFQEGIDRVLKSTKRQGFALIADYNKVKYAVMTNCGLISVGEEFSKKPLALAVQKNSTLKNQLSAAILKLKMAMKLEVLKEKWWNNNPERLKCDDSELENDGVSLANIGGIFILLLIGVALACMSLAVEYCYYKNRRPPNTRVVAIKESPDNKTRNKH